VLPFGSDGDEKGRDEAPVRSVLFDLVSSSKSLELSAVAAHLGYGFANLLAPVLGGVTLLSEQLPREHPLHDRLEGTRQAAAAARAFAQRVALLDPKRIPTLHRAETAALLREWLDLLRGMLRPKIIVDAAAVSISDFVRVDRHQLGQALLELALNAQDAMPEGGSLWLDVTSVQGEGGVGRLPVGRFIRVRMRDSGCGIAPAILERSLEPFVTTKVPGTGAGLGLPIVAAAVRQHGGLLAIETRPSVGTTVSILLPCHVTMTRPSDIGPPAESGPSRDAKLGPAVLVVEDNAMVRRSIEVTLRSAGYQVTSVESGERCIEEVGRLDQPLDLLISDVIMPEMSGDQLLGRVRELRPAVPVLFISGYDRSSLARRKHPLANEHFLQKPFDSEDLFGAVTKALRPRPGNGDG
jgi:two-component system cell cycle sensor histidine kinase/response regulator CckA